MASIARRSDEPDPEDPLGITLRYSPQNPTAAQHAFLLLDDLGITEAFYGGAGGGGKSSALLMSALRYVHVPGYAAVLFRRTFADLDKPGALMDRGKQWLAGAPGVTWNDQKHRFTFATGASLSFAHLQHSDDKYSHQGAEYQFIGFDELTQFPKDDFRYLFTRLRVPELNDESTAEDRARVEALTRVPLRMRSAANPGGRGHIWVKARYIERVPDEDDPEDTQERADERVFIPAKLDDNPHINAESYRKSLANVDPHLREQMLNGDWEARPPGDWVYDGAGIDAAIRLGAELDELLARGEAPPPAGGLLATGTDWGEHTHGLVGWPLEGGGLWVVAGKELVGVEPGDSTAHIIGGTLEDGTDLPGLLGQVYRAGIRQPAPGKHAALPEVRDPLELVSDHRFDGAGIQSMRTYAKRARIRHANTVTTAVPFGAPIKSGAAGSGQTRSFKAETIGHLRRLFKRAGEGKTTGVIAISPRACATLVRQLRGLQFADVDLGTIAKGDDHGPDALIALDAPIARRNRA